MADQMSPEDARALVKPSDTEDELIGFDPEDNYDESDGLWDAAEEIMESEGKVLIGDAAEEGQTEEDVAENTADWREISEQLRRENEELRKGQEVQKAKEFAAYLETLEPEERLKAELAHERDLRRQSEMRVSMNELSSESPKTMAAWNIFTKHFDLEVEDASQLRRAAAEMEKEFEAIFGAMGARVEKKAMKDVKQAWGVDTGLHRQKGALPKPGAAGEEKLKAARAEIIKSGNHPDAVARFLRERARMAQAG